MADFTKYGAPVKTDTATTSSFAKYGTPTAVTPTVETSSTPTSLGSKVKTAVGSFAKGTGATLPLLGLDYLGKKGVDTFGTEQMKQNLANSPSLTQKFDTAFDVDKNPKTAMGGEAAGFVGGLFTGNSEAKAIPIVADAIKAKNASKLSDTAGAIVQGGKDDIERATKALINVDTKGVKTSDELLSRLNDTIDRGSKTLDKVLEMVPGTKKLGDLAHEIKAGDVTVKHNFVEDAINQLREHYAKINDPAMLAKMTQLKQKADGVYDAAGQLVKEGEGLTIKELNDLARLHGRDLNAFNANGEAASGLTKQAAENTRSGLKDTARALFGDKIYAKTDSALSDLIRTRDLVQNASEKANALKQKVIERGLGNKVTHAILTVIDTVTGGGLKGVVRFLTPRNVGEKTMNYLDWEKSLGSNLKKFEKLLDSNAADSDFIKSLEDVLGKGLPKTPSL